MDETLGNLHQFYPILAVLRPSIYKTYIPSIGNNSNINLNLDKAYTYLVQRCAEQYRTFLNEDLIIVLKSVPYQKAFIYSNNSVLEILQFASDVIDAVIGRKVFCECIHLYHPIRDNDYDIIPDIPHNKYKTWETIQLVLNELCGVPEEIRPEETFFFDDLLHPNLYTNLPDGHYVHIDPPYRTSINPLTLKGIYLDVIGHTGLQTSMVFFNYLDKLYAKMDARTRVTVISLQPDSFAGGSRMRSRAGFRKTKKSRKMKSRNMRSRKMRSRKTGSRNL